MEKLITINYEEYLELVKYKEYKEEFNSDIMFKMRDFTKSINKYLKTKDIVKDWEFCINTIYNNCLELTINYYNDFHSRTIFNLEKYDFEELVNSFEIQFDKNTEEWNNLHCLKVK